MYNQKRIYRVFQLINYLRSNPSKSPKTLSEILEISERSVYRYIDLINQLGFEVKKSELGRYYIQADDDGRIPFTPQEVDYIRKMVKSVGKKNTLAAAVLQKIGQHTVHQVAARNIFDANIARIVELLSYAIQEKKQVFLLKYYSARSETIADRFVEPVKFTDNYGAISAFEIDSQINKYFNIERISDVHILDSDWEFEQHHEFFEPDVFGFQGSDMDKEVEFEMSLRASLLLQEEFPMSKAFIQMLPGGKRFVFKAQVQAFEGPARFVRGFREEITIVGSADFEEFVNDTDNPSED